MNLVKVIKDSNSDNSTESAVPGLQAKENAPKYNKATPMQVGLNTKYCSGGLGEPQDFEPPE